MPCKELERQNIPYEYHYLSIKEGSLVAPFQTWEMCIVGLLHVFGVGIRYGEWR